jgi:hypothetical protein
MMTMMIVIAMVIMTAIVVAITLSFGVVVLVAGNGFGHSWIRQDPALVGSTAFFIRGRTILCGTKTPDIRGFCAWEH